MRSAKKLSFYLFTSAVVLVPAAAMTACGDDDTGGGGGVVLLEAGSDARTTSDGSVTDSGNKTDAPITPIDSGNKDVNQPDVEAGTDAGADADADADAGSQADADAATADADAGTDADADAGSKPTSIPDGTYKITSWTCEHGGTKDVLALISTGADGISEVDETIAALVDTVQFKWKGAGNCVNTGPYTLAYPQAGTVTVSNLANTNTCSGTCTAAQCTALADPATSKTYDFTINGTVITTTRPLPANEATGTAQAAAGCTTAGDAETVVLTKQ